MSTGRELLSKILIADDDIAVRDIACTLVERVGYSVFEAENGEQAIEVATAEHPDLILLDIAMPGIGGVEALRRLKASEATSEIPVVVFSTYSEKELVTECVELGAADYLTKPTRHGWLLTTVKDILETSTHDYALSGS